MPSRYVVKQGDYLAGIARSQGFSDWNTIWNDPGNASLRAQRANANILYAGDILVIPDRQNRSVAAGTDQRAHFKVKRHPLQLALVLSQQYRKPLAKRSCSLMIGSTGTEPVTDSQGLLKAPMPDPAAEGTLVIHGADPAMPDRAVRLLIGHLDPLDTADGQRQRLDNLGYYASAGVAADPVEAAAWLRSAVEEFQCDHGLAVDGDCGPATQGKLKQVHGC
jgi:hypothetical protein